MSELISKYNPNTVQSKLNAGITTISWHTLFQWYYSKHLAFAAVVICLHVLPLGSGAACSSPTVKLPTVGLALLSLQWGTHRRDEVGRIKVDLMVRTHPNLRRSWGGGGDSEVLVGSGDDASRGCRGSRCTGRAQQRRGCRGSRACRRTGQRGRPPATSSFRMDGAAARTDYQAQR